MEPYTVTNRTVLIVDNDTALCELIHEHLSMEGFTTDVAHDGISAIKKAINKPFDAIILEIMLPQKNGFDVLKSIREHLNTPILILTARSDDIDRIVGLELGADDYLTKPCNPRELTARIKAILRRTQQQPTLRPVIRFDNLLVNCIKRQVFIADKLLDLTNTEFNILEILIKSPGQAFSKEELTEYALGRKFTAYDRSIDVHISNLRNKLGTNSANEIYLKTVRGFGYLFNVGGYNSPSESP